MKLLPLAFIFDTENSILLLKRIDRKTWEPVKWWIEKNKTHQQAIVREIEEETWLTNDDFTFFHYDWAREFKGENLTLHIYCLKTYRKRPNIIINNIISWWIDHDKYWWFDIHQIEWLKLDYPQNIIPEIYKCYDLCNK